MTFKAALKSPQISYRGTGRKRQNMLNVLQPRAECAAATCCMSVLMFRICCATALSTVLPM